MKLAIGIVLLLAALWLLYGTIRLWPPGSYRPRMLHPSTSVDIVTGLLLVSATCVTGIALISGASWWWLLLGGAAIVSWLIIAGRLQKL